MTSRLTGSCLCGGVAYELTGDVDDVVTCHCEQCRKTSGHHVAATRTPKGNCKLTNDETLTWYQSSESASRGFCNRCGGNLFWRSNDGPNISIFAGTLDLPTGLKTRAHIFVTDKGDYYDLLDHAPQYPEAD